jgi:hypothetical protein
VFELSFLFFLDESGQDHGESPYEVRCAVAVHDSRLWDLVLALKNAELDHFGIPYAGPKRELKAKLLLKRKTFRLADQMQPMDADERRALARAALTDGANANRHGLTALGQAKLAFCRRVLEVCADQEVAYFASIVHPDARKAAGNGLRKDYSYLFQRLFYFLEQHAPWERGLLVMDEIDQAEAHLLIGQMRTYFQTTRFGQARCRRIVPEPFFVHSELTTGVQIADLVAYTLAWNVRMAGMDRPVRPELNSLGDLVRAQQRLYRVPGLAYSARSFVYLDDLRTRSERDLELREKPILQQLELADRAPAG